MPELIEAEKTKESLVKRGSGWEKRQAKLKADEEEIKRLEAEASGEELEEAEAPKKEETDSETEEEALSAEERTFKKRYGDLRRHIAQKEKDWEEKLKRLEAQQNEIAPPKSEEELAEWMAQHPDVAGFVKATAAKQAEEMFADANIRIENIDAEREALRRDSAEQSIRNVHSDFDQLRSADAFHNWAGDQPKWVQDALYENADDPDSVIRVIDLYKMDNGLTKNAKKSQAKDAARAVTRTQTTNVDVDKASGKIRESEIKNMSMEEYADREEEINEAIKYGNIIYDLKR